MVAVIKRAAKTGGGGVLHAAPVAGGRAVVAAGVRAQAIKITFYAAGIHLLQVINIIHRGLAHIACRGERAAYHNHIGINRFNGPVR